MTASELHPTRIAPRLKRPSGRKQQHGDHQDEDRCLLPDDLEEAADPAFDQPEQQCGGDRARDVAETADDHQGEGLEDQRLAHRRSDKLNRGERGTGEPAQRRRQHDGIARHRARLDADHQRGLAVLRDRAHRPPELGVVEQRVEQGEGGDGSAGADDPRPGDADRPDREAIEAVLRVDHARVCREGKLRRMQDDDRDRERNQDAALERTMLQPREEQLVENKAADRGDDNRREQGRPIGKPDCRQRKRHGERAGHEELAVGEIDDLEHAEDQRQPDRDQRIEQAEHDAIDGQLQQVNWVDVHGPKSQASPAPATNFLRLTAREHCTQRGSMHLQPRQRLPTADALR